MVRVAVLVDGFNFYHSIKNLIDDGLDQGLPVRWFDYRALANSFLHQLEHPGHKEIVQVHYFSALAHHKREGDPDHVKHHQNYIRALEHTNIKSHLHRFKPRHRECKECGEKIRFHEEKETDVAIASRLLEIVANDKADLIVMVTGDTDMVPAVGCAYEIAPSCRLWFAFPYKRKNGELARAVKGRGGSFSIGPSVYKACLFDDPFITARKKKIFKPKHW